MFTLRLHVPHFICMLVFISLAFSIENKGLQMTDHQDAVMYLHEQHLLHPTNGHCVPTTQIKSGHKTENNPKNTQSPKFLQTPLGVTHSARGIEYPLPGFMCRDAQPEICEVWHPWWNYYLVFSPEKNYPIKWWPCIVAVVAVRKYLTCTEGQAITSQCREKKGLEGKWKQSEIIPSTLDLTLPPKPDCFLFSNKRT